MLKRTQRAGRLTALTWLTACVALIGGCAAGETTGADESQLEPRTLEVEFAGHFDGENFFIAPVGPTHLFAEDGREVGVSAEPLLGTVDAGAFGSGVTATGSEYVALEQQTGSLARLVNNVASGAAWTPSRCGPAPQSGTCVQIRMRNLYADRVIQHAHFELTSLTATGSTLYVSVPAPGATTDTAPSDSFFGVAGSGRGLWRFGSVPRATPAGVGPVLYWAFTGTTPGGSNFTFSFIGRVRADLVRPAIRADLVSGTSDGPPSYGGGAPGNGTARDVHVDAAGRFVVFTSNATNLVPGTTTAVDRVYRADLDTNTVTLVSTGSVLATPQSCGSEGATISDDGTVVAFESDCQFEPNDTNAVRDVYVRRLADGGTLLASRSFNAAGSVGNADSRDASIAPNGAYVVFTSLATNLALYRPAGRTFRDIYRRDVSSLSAPNVNIVPITRLTTSATPLWLDADSANPVVGVAGTTTVTVFESAATNAVTTPDTNGVSDIFAFVHGATSTTPASRTIISVSSTGALLSSASLRPAISNDGNLIAFDTDAPGVVPGVGGGRHVYVRNRVTPASIGVADRTPSGTASAGGAFNASLSDAGRFVSFQSTATDLTNTAPGSTPQLYIVDRIATDRGFTRAFLVSLTDGFAPASGSLGAATIAGSGEYAVFTSDSTTLVPGSSGTHAFRVPFADVRDQ